MSFWKALANKWRIKQTGNISKDKEEEINQRSNQVNIEIAQGKSVPSAMDEILSDMDDYDDIW